MNATSESDRFLEHLVFEIAQGGSGETGDAFFSSLVRHLARALLDQSERLLGGGSFQSAALQESNLSLLVVRDGIGSRRTLAPTRTEWDTFQQSSASSNRRPAGAIRQWG